MRRTTALSTLAALGALAPAHATVVQYSSRAAFSGAAGALDAQDFESFAPTPGAFRGVSFDFGRFSAINQVVTTAPNAGSIIAGGLVNGTNEIVCSVALSGQTFRITFDHAITAFGFDASNLADQRFDNLEFNNTAGDVIAVHDAIDQTRFWGFISDTPFTTFVVRQTGFGSGGGATDGFRIDNMAFTAVPMPTAILLAAPALAALAAHRRRA